MISISIRSSQTALVTDGRDLEICRVGVSEFWEGRGIFFKNMFFFGLFVLLFVFFGLEFFCFFFGFDFLFWEGTRGLER